MKVKWSFGVFLLFLTSFLFAGACSQPKPEEPPGTETSPQKEVAKEPASTDDSGGGNLNDSGANKPDASGTADSSVKDSSTSSVAGPDSVIKTFTGEHIYFGGGKNKRVVTKEFEFPEKRFRYDSIKLKVALQCPNQKCDWWDRFGNLSVVLNPGEKPEKVIELNRFITPYRVRASWEVDVTPFRPLLTGKVTLRLFIDTWVGPGHAQGDGWLVSANFFMTGGTKTKMPSKIIPIWSPKSFTYGNPKQPVAKSVPDQEVELPDAPTRVMLHGFITGHGQGNFQNCAEFCPKNHTFVVGSKSSTRKIWRNNCTKTKAQPQYGNWQPPRAGWCPGAEVLPWMEDVTAQLKAGGKQTIQYKVEAYTNTCRPDSPQCTGCVRNWGNCKYNYNGHTKPYYYMSAALFVYE